MLYLAFCRLLLLKSFHEKTRCLANFFEKNISKGNIGLRVYIEL